MGAVAAWGDCNSAAPSEVQHSPIDKNRPFKHLSAPLEKEPLVSTKAERKELRQPDEFQVQASRVMQWMIDRRALLIGVGAVVVIAVVGVWAAGEYQNAQEEKAGAALSSALALVARPVMGEGASMAPGAETFATDEAKTTALQTAFEKVRADFPGRHAAWTAGAQLGFLKLKHGDAAGATTLLNEYIATAGKDDVLRAAALAALGAALENQGKLEEAAQAYARLTEAGAPADAAYQAARIALLEKKPDAKEQLEKVAKDYAKDPAAADARRTLELAALPPPPAAGAVAPAADVTAKPAAALAPVKGKPAPKAAAKAK